MSENMSQMLQNITQFFRLAVIEEEKQQWLFMEQVTIIIIINAIVIVIMVTQLIPTSHIPTRWEYVIMMKGGNMTQSNSHHTHV